MSKDVCQVTKIDWKDLFSNHLHLISNNYPKLIVYSDKMPAPKMREDIVMWGIFSAK